jgi:hypothetical protein
MALVDLRGREGESDVLALLEPGLTWTVVGWERGDRLVACAGVERTSADELTIRRSAPMRVRMPSRFSGRLPESRPAHGSSRT